MELVDKNLILRKISELEVYMGQIKEFSDITTDEYRDNWKTQRIVERTLQIKKHLGDFLKFKEAILNYLNLLSS